MSLLDSIRYRLRVFSRPRDHETELAEELKFHVDLEAMQREAKAHGTLSRDAARRAAHQRLGNRTYYQEESRRESGLTAFDTLSQDVRFALRSFRRTPGFTAISIATLAIGIGANTAIFSAVDTLLLAPLPFRAPERLMDVTLTIPPGAGGREIPGMVWSYPKVEVFRANQSVFADMTAWFSTQSTVRVGDDALRLAGEFVDQHYFTTLGVVPALGRGFLPNENRPDAPAVAVISDEMWRSVFNADPSVIGKQIGIDLSTFTIVGVAPPGFGGVSGQARFWMPFLSSPSAWDVGYFSNPYQHTFHLIARLAPGESSTHAAAIAREIGPRVDALYPERGPSPRHWGIAARTLDETRIDDDGRHKLFLLLGAVGMVLLVACANVANLSLVRATSRRREIAVRLAIGATRARVVRQLLVESVLLAVAGGLASLAVAEVGVRVISAARPALWGSQSASGIGTVFVDAIHLDLTTLAFTAAVAIVVGILFGLAPAVQTTRPELTSSLKADSGASVRAAFSRRLSLRDALTAFEIALAVVLLSGSGVLVRSLLLLTAVHPGFDAENVLTMRVNRAAAWSRDSISRFYDVALDRLHAIPGVTSAAIADCSPESGGCDGGNFIALDGESGSRGAPAGLHWTTPEWTDVVRVPVLHGRAIGRSDGPGTPRVAMVSEKAAREFWPTGDPIGKRLVRGRDTVRVVGVVGDVRFYGLQTPPRPEVYISYYQFPMSFRMMLHLRTRGDPAAVAEAARRALREVAPGFPVYDVATLEDRVGGSLGQSRFLARLLSTFAVLALVLAAIGTYGVISYGVAQRTREMGVRIALGATGSDVVRLVIRQGIVLAVVGGSIGVPAALVASRWLRSLLYDVEPGDPVTLVGISAILLAAVVIASWIPARRAANVPAVEALRGG